FLIAAGASGGALLVGCNRLPPGERVGAAGVLRLVPPQTSLNAWVRIASDGTVTIPVPRAEMGQGITTALPMLVAEELDIPWTQVRFAEAPLDAVYRNATILLDSLSFESTDEGFFAETTRGAISRVARMLGVQATGGSTSVRDGWDVMRIAGASAREMLVAAAVKQWGVAALECKAEQGRVSHASGKSASYAELASLAASMPPPASPKLKSPKDWKLIGTPVPRLDTVAKVDGSAQFGIDVRLPGQLYAAVRQCPVFGGTLASHDAAQVLATQGVTKVVALANAVAVVAEQYWIAQQALETVKITWNEGAHATLDSASISQRYEKAMREGDASSYRKEGDVTTAFADAQQIEATYSVPFLAHATMEPMNCTAMMKDGKVEVWVGSQSATLVRYIAAKVLGVEREHVTVHSPFLGGGFGRRAEMDVVAQAVSIAKEIQGRPVQLIWSREEDMQHDMYRPAVLSRFRAAFTVDKRFTAWTHRMTGPSVNYSFMERLIPWMASNMMDDKTNADGAAGLPYEIPNQLVEHVLEQVPVPVGFWRSVGHSQNAFFTECFFDEVCAALGKDPYEFRRQLLAKKPRFRAVLELAATKAGWGTPPAQPGVHRGIALHESFGSIVAQVAEVSVDAERRIRVHRVVCAIDCGPVVNPDTVVAQMESGIIFGLSAALEGEITIKNGRVEQSNFHDYPVLRMMDSPAIEVHIVQSTDSMGGVGEPGTPPIAPAVANAVFAATGKRLRQLPLRLG
ncbi:MAG: molybdopterin cofactor-binding domain-containing protein, partial [Burkholderiales bacterium]